LRRLGAFHDIVTRGGFAAAALCTALIAASFCYEVAARYFFNAPTEWATPFVTYGLCAMIFLAMPELTRRAEHVAITILADRAAGTCARVLQASILILAAGACLVAAWFSADATLGQYRMGILTHPPYAIEKWLLSVLIPYGMLSSGIYFLRQLAGVVP
jgi:TRAP-type C4-dicarboxylate transport system permease small subunit